MFGSLVLNGSESIMVALLQLSLACPQAPASGQQQQCPLIEIE
jgi:hypothetical protein